MPRTASAVFSAEDRKVVLTDAKTLVRSLKGVIKEMIAERRIADRGHKENNKLYERNVRAYDKDMDKVIKQLAKANAQLKALQGK